MLLSKYRMRHRDPKLFYLTMDIYIKRTGIPLKRTLTLEDEARPAELKSCHPWGECKFTLQMRKGGLGMFLNLMTIITIFGRKHSNYKFRP